MKFCWHKWKSVEDSKYVSKFRWSNCEYPSAITYYDYVCVKCGKLKLKARYMKRREDEILKQKEEEKNKARKIWFDSLSKEDKAKIFTDKL